MSNYHVSIYFDETYDPTTDDIYSIDVFQEIAALLYIDTKWSGHKDLLQFNLNRNKLSERRDYLKAIKEYTNGS